MKFFLVPWWAEVHIFIGFVMFYWILTPILYYTNVRSPLLFFQSISSSLQSWDLAYFPISANEPFDRFGKPYNISRVLLPNDTFNETAYNLYSPLYLSATYAMTYLLAFALSTSVLVHTALYHGKSLMDGMKKIKIERDDIHAKLMRNYPEVPEWWYISACCFFFSVAIIAAEVGFFFSFCVRRLIVLYFSFVGLAYGCTGLGLVTLCTSSDYLYATFWIYLCHDGSRSTIPNHSYPTLFNPSERICRYPSMFLRKSYQERFFLANHLPIWYLKLIQCKLYLLVHRLYKISSWDIMWKSHHAQRLWVCEIIYLP